jgi:ribosomal protein S18 acetylase RimI-like enzyme
MIITNTLEPGDLGQVVMLHGLLYAKEYGYDFTFEAYVAEPLAQFVKRKNSRERIWLAKVDDKIFGSICICEVSTSEAQLRWFLVGPEARGLGLGKELIDKALSFCSVQKYNKVTLWTVKGLDAAKSLYVRNGFIVQEEIEHEVWGSVQVEQRYEKDL